MKTAIVVLLCLGLGYWAGIASAKSQLEATLSESLTQYFQTSEGVSACRQVVKEAGG